MAIKWEVKNTTATLKDDAGTTVATITGLATGLSTYTDGEDTKIYGIEVDGSTITLSRKVLSSTTATLTSDNYSLKLDADCKAQEGGGWTVDGTAAYLMDGTSSSYTTDGTTVTYSPAKLGSGGVLATLSGLASGTAADSRGEIPGVTVEGTTIEISKGSVIGSSGLTVSGTGYTLALGNELKPAATGTITWESTKKGEASFTATMSEGYSISSDATTITATPSTNATVKVSGLNAKVTTDVLKAWINGTGDYEDEPAFSVSGSVITVNDNAILTSSTKLTGADYTFKLTEYTDEENPQNSTAEISEDGWSMAKGKTAATYGHTIGIGYYADGAAIKQNAKKASTVTLVTVSGLPKAAEATNQVDGLSVSGNVITVSQDLLNSGTDKLIKADSKKGIEERLGVKKLTIGAKDNYTFAFDTDVEEPEDDEAGRVWSFDSSSKTKDGETTYTGKGTAVLSIVTSDGWAIDTSTKGASKTISYVPETTTTFVTLSGLTTDFIDSESGELSENFELEKDNDDVYTGNILYKGGTTEGASDTTDVYAIKVTTGEDGVKTLTLNESVFGGKKIAVKNNTKVSGETYELALDADYAVKDVETPYWEVTSAGKATLIGGKTDGYVTNSKTGAIDYTAAKKTTLATITLKGYLNEKNKVALTEDDITALKTALDAATTFTKDGDGKITGGKVTLDNTVLTADAAITSIAFAAKDNYTFDLVDGEVDSENGVDVYKENGEDPVWTVTPKSAKEADADKAKGTATYGATMTDGYQLSADGKTVTLQEGGEKVLFTLSGLDTSMSVTDLKAALTGESTEEDVAADTTTPAVTVSGTTVTINDNSIFGTNKIALGKKDGYKLDVSNIKDTTLADAQWNIDTKKGTATYYNGTSGGWALDKNSEVSASYTKPTTSKTIATITGLKKGVSFADPQITTAGGSRIVLTQDMLSSTQVKLSGTTDYGLLLYGVAGPTSSNEDWTISKGTATYTQDVSEGWTLSDDKMSVNYSAGVAGQKVVTISGLNKDITSEDLKEEGGTYEGAISLNGTEITLKNAVLNNANVSAKSAIKGTNYTLKLGGDVETEVKPAVKEWVNSKGTATYKEYVKGYYTEDNAKGSIVYTKETKGTTLATIKGLNPDISGTEIDKYIEISADNVITFKEGALLTEESESETKATNKTTVTLSTVKGGTAYTLDLTEDQKVVYDNPAFGDLTKGKVTLSAGISEAGYTIDTKGNLVYVPTKITKSKTEVDNSVDLAVVSGVADLGGLSVGTEVITVSKSALGDSNLTLDKNTTYTLQLDEDELENEEFKSKITEGTATVKSGTYTLKGTTTNAYTLKDDKKTVAVTKGITKTDGATLVTIKGLVKTDLEASDLEKVDTVISLSAENVAAAAKNKSQVVTVESAYGYTFDFNSDYSSASIVGSKNNDNIYIGGTGISVNTAKGDDTVTFSSYSSGEADAADGESTATSGNTFFYAVGDGADVIVDFTATSDKIKLTTKGAKVTAAGVNGDAVLTITDSKKTAKTAGTITLTGLGSAASNIVVLDSTGATLNGGTAASADLASSYDLIYDNNYVTGSQLGDLASSADAGLSGDLNTNYNYTNLTQQQTIAYGGDKK